MREICLFLASWKTNGVSGFIAAFLQELIAKLKATPSGLHGTLTLFMGLGGSQMFCMRLKDRGAILLERELISELVGIGFPLNPLWFSLSGMMSRWCE